MKLKNRNLAYTKWRLPYLRNPLQSNEIIIHTTRRANKVAYSLAGPKKRKLKWPLKIDWHEWRQWWINMPSWTFARAFSSLQWRKDFCVTVYCISSVIKFLTLSSLMYWPFWQCQMEAKYLMAQWRSKGRETCLCKWDWNPSQTWKLKELQAEMIWTQHSWKIWISEEETESIPFLNNLNNYVWISR